MTATSIERPAGSPRRTLVRRIAIGLAAGVAALYVAVFFVQLPHMHETDNPAPAYIALALVYIAVAASVALRDVARVLWIGAAVQVILLGLFFWLHALPSEHGDEGFILDMLGLAIAITATQFVILGLLAYLARTSRGTKVD